LKGILMTINYSSSGDAVPTGMRKFALAAVIAGTIALGVSAFGHTAIARADWDIEAYDDCVKIGTDEVACCRLSGGQIGNEGVCVAPPARILQQSPTILQNIPLGPKLAPTDQATLPTNTVTATAS
jgi:hypothetical protein